MKEIYKILPAFSSLNKLSLINGTEFINFSHAQLN